jgi:hypothetical protein
MLTFYNRIGIHKKFVYMASMRGGDGDEESLEQEGSGQGGILLDWPEKGSKRESHERMP